MNATSLTPPSPRELRWPSCVKMSSDSFIGNNFQQLSGFHHMIQLKNKHTFGRLLLKSSVTWHKKRVSYQQHTAFISVASVQQKTWNFPPGKRNTNADPRLLSSPVPISFHLDSLSLLDEMMMAVYGIYCFSIKPWNAFFCTSWAAIAK